MPGIDYTNLIVCAPKDNFDSLRKERKTTVLYEKYVCFKNQ